MTDQSFAVRLQARANLSGVQLQPDEVRRLCEYFDLLQTWNRTVNLTGLSLDPPSDEAIDRLWIEPLIAASLLRRDLLDHFAPPAAWFDLGSGSGSPAIPMKIMLPSLRLTMVESKSRKGAFLREAIRRLQLTDAEVLVERVEGLGNPGIARLVTIRAVRLDAEILGAASRLLASGSRLALFQRRLEPVTPSGFALGRIEPLFPMQSSWLHLYVKNTNVPRGTLDESR